MALYQEAPQALPVIPRHSVALRHRNVPSASFDDVLAGTYEIKKFDVYLVIHVFPHKKIVSSLIISQLTIFVNPLSGTFICS